jgi:DNA-binding GntR family transcriptional regulator
MSQDGMALRQLISAGALRDRVHSVIREAIATRDVYADPDGVKLDERQLAEELGVSRTPVREALSRLEQEGLVRMVPRRGAFVARKSKAEIMEVIYVWAALESMAARLATECATDTELNRFKARFASFEDGDKAYAQIDEYSQANIEFHQAVIRLGHCHMLEIQAESLFVHMGWIRAHTISNEGRAEVSVVDHARIINALHERDTELADQLVREHSMHLAEHVEKYADI